MITAMPLSHSDEEVLAAFVDGQLTGEELQQVISHLAECEECRMTIADPAMFQQQEEQEEQQRKRASRRVWWAAAAAAVVIAVLVRPGYTLFKNYQANRTLQPLWALQKVTGRPIDGRFSSQMDYGKHLTPRGGDKRDQPEDLMLTVAPISEKYENDTSPPALRVKAAIQAATESNPSKALDILETVPTNKRNAAIWNDLAALKLGEVNWKPESAPQLLQDALAAADQALRQKPGMPEALFNRAMILKKMNDRRAPAAINDYLAVDPQSQWAEEVSEKEPQL